MRNFLVFPAAAALAFGIVGSSSPAAAKPMNSCQVRHSYCTEHMCDGPSGTARSPGACGRDRRLCGKSLVW